MLSYGVYPDFESLRSAMEKELREHIENLKKRNAFSKRYRIEHCLRVASIGREVAEKAGLDAELLELGCLLHDIGKWDAQKPVDHGRAGALIVKPLLTEAGLDPAEVNELAQGIAMHTDGLWNPRNDKHGTKKSANGERYIVFDTEPSVLARSIGDCDNIDRFSAYRIADTLRHIDFMELSTDKQIAWIESYLSTLRELRRYHCAAEPAQHMWVENLAFQENFFMRLLDEIN